MPILTNVHNIEEAIARAVQRDTYDRVGDISVTGLIRPPQVAHLEYLHQHEITEDVSEGLWLLLGSAIHVVLERAELDNVLQEERVMAEVEGWSVGGKPDLWQEPGMIKDYKVTSVWRFLKGDPADWEMQQNFYAALYRREGFPVTKLEIPAILRDWYAAQAICACRHQGSDHVRPANGKSPRLRCRKRPQNRRCKCKGYEPSQSDYPNIPFKVVSLPVWPEELAEERLAERVRLHQEGREGRFGPCTDDERWSKPDVWAVKKKGNKRAMSGGLQETEKAAKEFAAKAAHPTEIELRPGEDVRCARYCKVAPWCEQWKALRPPEKGAK